MRWWGSKILPKFTLDFNNCNIIISFSIDSVISVMNSDLLDFFDLNFSAPFLNIFLIFSMPSVIEVLGIREFLLINQFLEK